MVSNEMIAFSCNAKSHDENSFQLLLSSYIPCWLLAWLADTAD